MKRKNTHPFLRYPGLPVCKQLLSDAKSNIPVVTLTFSSALRCNFYCLTHPENDWSGAHGRGVPKVKNRLQGKKYRISRHSFLARPPPYQLLRQLYSHRVGRQGFCKKYYLISVEIFCKIHFSLAWVGWGA